MANIEFEFGETRESDQFFHRNPKFYPAFEQLMITLNKCFGREYQHSRPLEDLVFGLGQTCRDDFLEVLLLAVNGHGVGATKLVRGLYERAATTAYLIQNPSKVERFISFAAGNERKLMREALKVFSQEEFERATRSTVAEIESNYQDALKVFKAKKLPGTWDVDFASLVQRVSGAYPHYYLATYVLPNLQIHASLASAFRVRGEQAHVSADVAVAHAHGIMLLVVSEQNSFFSLNLKLDIEACSTLAADAWDPTSRVARPISDNAGDLSATGGSNAVVPGTLSQ